MTYVKRYVGGFLDRPTITTPADAAFLNAVETELIRLGGNIVNADVAVAAAIARSKLDFGAGLVNADIAAAAGIVSSKLATTLAGGPPGMELTYNEFTALVSVTSTSEATANTVVTASAYTFDGVTPVLVEFFAPWVDAPSGFATMFVLYQDGVSIGRFGETYGAVSEVAATASAKRRITPTAGSHTYSIRAFMNAASTGQINAGVGGSGQFLPGFIRITRA